MAVLLVFSIFDMGLWQSKHITARAARDLIATRRDAQIFVDEYQNGMKLLCLLVPRTEKPAGKPARYFAPLDESTLLALKTSGVPYKTLKQGQDFEILGWPGRMLFLLSFMVVIAGIVVLALGFRNKKRPAFIPPATLQSQ